MTGCFNQQSTISFFFLLKDIGILYITNLIEVSCKGLSLFLRIQIALEIVIFLYQTILFEEYGNKNVYMFLTAYFQVL